MTSRMPGDGFAFCKNYLPGSCWCFLVLPSAFPVCIFGASGFPAEELRIKLDILRLTLKGNTEHFSMADTGILSMLKACYVLWSIGYCWPHFCIENCPSAPNFPGSHGLLPMTLQHCCGPGLLAELPSLPSAHAAHCVSLAAAVGVVCLAVFANLAFSCLVSCFVDGWRDHTEHAEGRGCVQWIMMKCLVCVAAWARFEREPSWCLSSELLLKQGQA